MGFDGDAVISSLCPSGLCCQMTGGCEWTEDAQSLCAENRDSGSLLCSQCIEGYSESINSAKCTKCGETVYFQYLALPFCIAVIVVLISLATNRMKKDLALKRKTAKTNVGVGSATEILMVRMNSMKKHKISMFSLFKITIYYEQVW